MVRGEPEKRLEVMHDKLTGAAAVGTGFIVLAITGLSYGSFTGMEILKAAIVSEIIAKESMVLTAYFGKTPSYNGMGYYVVASMRNKHLKLFSSIALSAIIAILLIGFNFIYLFIAMAVTVAIFTAYANKAFDCVTGDILGATNEINRMISLIVLLATMS